MRLSFPDTAWTRGGAGAGATSPNTALARSIDRAPFLVPCALLGLLIWNNPGFLINSDQLTLASFVWDLRHHAEAWANFQQPHSPSFVPDLAIQWIVQSATGDWRLGIAAHVTIAIAGLWALMTEIAARIAGSGRTETAIAVSLVATPLLVAATLGLAGANQDGDVLFPWLFVLQPTCHGGTFLLGLTAAILTRRALDHASTADLLGIALISAAADASDGLYLIFFLAPVTAALLGLALVDTANRRTVPKLLAAAWGGAALGSVFVSHVSRQYMPPLSLGSILTHAEGFLVALAQLPVPLFCEVGLIIALAVDAYRSGLRRWLGGFWPVFATVSAISAIGFTSILYEGIGSFRYAHAVLWWPVILGAAALAPRLPAWSATRAAPMVYLTAGVALAAPAAGWRLPSLLAWQSPVVACLHEAGLHTGLAEYWSARLISVASDWDLQVEQINPDGSARVWGNDPVWFTHDTHDPMRRPDYRFIVMSELWAPDIVAAYGQPDRRLACGPATVWIYDTPGEVYRGVTRASPRLADLFAAAPPSP